MQVWLEIIPYIFDVCALMQVIHSARANATHNHKLDPDRLLIGKCLVEFVYSSVCRLFVFTHFSPNFGKSNMYVDLFPKLHPCTAEAFVGKGFFKKRVSYHSKGRSGVKERPECRLTVVVREMTPEEEAEVARLRVSNFRKLTKRERRLVPHKLIETTPVWHRKTKTGGQVASVRLE